MNSAPGVESVLLMTSLTASSNLVLVLQLPVQLMVFPPMVMWVRFGSAFVGRTSQITRVCATSDMRPCGMLLNLMGRIVSVPVTRC